MATYVPHEIAAKEPFRTITFLGACEPIAPDSPQDDLPFTLETAFS